MVLLAHGRASAMVEYCPAKVTLAPAGLVASASDATSLPASTYALWLSGASARSVSGRAAIHTDAGWFVVNVPETALAQVTQHWKDRYVEFSRNTYESAPLYIAFPKPVSVASAYMLIATTHGETQLGWDGKGAVQCSARVDRLDEPASYKPPSKEALAAQPHLVSPLPITALPPTGAKPLSATILSDPGETQCAVPFRDAQAVGFPRLSYPEAAKYQSVQSGDAFVRVAISATGKVDDAWIFAPTGSEPLDVAAVRAAKATTFTPAIVFCQKEPSMYMFRAEFNP